MAFYNKKYTDDCRAWISKNQNLYENTIDNIKSFLELGGLLHIYGVAVDNMPDRSLFLKYEDYKKYVKPYHKFIHSVTGVRTLLSRANPSFSILSSEEDIVYFCLSWLIQGDFYETLIYQIITCYDYPNNKNRQRGLKVLKNRFINESIHLGIKTIDDWDEYDKDMKEIKERTVLSEDFVAPQTLGQEGEPLIAPATDDDKKEGEPLIAPATDDDKKAGEPPIVPATDENKKEGEPLIVPSTDDDKKAGEPPIVPSTDDDKKEGEPLIVPVTDDDKKAGEPPIAPATDDDKKEGEPPIVPATDDDKKEGEKDRTVDNKTDKAAFLNMLKCNDDKKKTAVIMAIADEIKSINSGKRIAFVMLALVKNKKIDRELSFLSFYEALSESIRPYIVGIKLVSRVSGSNKYYASKFLLDRKYDDCRNEKDKEELKELNRICNVLEAAENNA